MGHERALAFMSSSNRRCAETSPFDPRAAANGLVAEESIADAAW